MFKRYQPQAVLVTPLDPQRRECYWLGCMQSGRVRRKVVLNVGIAMSGGVVCACNILAMSVVLDSCRGWSKFSQWLIMG